MLRLCLPSSTCTPQAGFCQDSASLQIVPSCKKTSAHADAEASLVVAAGLTKT